MNPEDKHVNCSLNSSQYFTTHLQNEARRYSYANLEFKYLLTPTICIVY